MQELLKLIFKWKVDIKMDFGEVGYDGSGWL
jgi:hypothetical protein